MAGAEIAFCEFVEKSKHEIMGPESFEQPESWIERAFSSGETPYRGVDHGKV